MRRGENKSGRGFKEGAGKPERERVLLASDWFRERSVFPRSGVSANRLAFATFWIYE